MDGTKCVMISGVSGFLGRHVARQFTKSGFRVVGVDSGAEENAPREYLNRYIAVRLPDDRFSTWLNEERPAILVHCAGRASVELSVSNPLSDFQGNVLLTFQILEALRLHVPTCKMVLLSSAAVYGNPKQLPTPESSEVAPISPYGFHKRQAELACESFSKVFGIRTCSLRIFSAYGPGLRRQVLWDLTSKAFRNETIHLMGTGLESRDFIHARDVAAAIQLVAERGELQGEVYNIASGEATSIQKLASLITQSLGISRPVSFDGQVRTGVPSQWCADIEKIRSLGFKAKMGFENGVEEYVRWAAPLLG